MNALCSEGRGTLFEGCFGVDQFADLGGALLLVLVLIVLPIALLIALALVRLFRARVKQSMRATAGEAVNPDTYQRPPNGPPGALEVAVLRVTRENSRAARSTPLVSRLRGALEGWHSCTAGQPVSNRPCSRRCWSPRFRSHRRRM